MGDRVFKNLRLNKIRFLKILKITEIFCLFLFYNVHKGNVFTIEMEDGREAPKKPCSDKFLMHYFLLLDYL